MALTDEKALAELCRVTREIKDLEAQAMALRETVMGAAMDEYLRTGAAPTWRLKGAGTVTLCTYDPRPRVFDDAALTGFVAEAEPDAVETVRRVRPGDLERLFGAWEATTTGAYVTADGEPVPGVVVAQRPPALQVRLARG